MGRVLVCIGLLWVAATANLAAAMSVSLNPSIPSPSPVGTIMTWSAAVPDAGSATVWYRFRSRLKGADFRMVRDYGPANTLDWTASEHEGVYEIEVSAINKGTGESALTAALFEMTSRISNNSPVISPTANPMVFLYSAPPCAAGGQMKVQFQSSVGIASTPYKACQDGLSMNFYLAGMQSGSTLWAQHTVESGSGVAYGPMLTFTTPSVTAQVPTNKVLQQPQVPLKDGILLQATLTQSTVATDLYGNLVWLYPGRISFLTRPEQGGSFFGIFEDFPSDQSHQLFREFDLVGTTIRETNAARVNEQLAQMGKRQISAFHHEARGLANGKVLVLASAEQIMTNIQGPGDVDVIGDMILVLDQDLQVVWAWDAFEYIDWYRKATLGEVCTQQAAGCPPFYLAQTANDWLHGNSLQLTPDGNILYSARHQDWLIKINYRNGAGTGAIIWRLGKDGDFQFNSTDPYPWFSHQHDGQFETGDNSTITVFDNGNVRRASDGSANSRGQVIRLDEQNHVASLILNADLGGYSFALGAAQKLPNGNYHFTLGWLPDGTSQSVEVDSLGNNVYNLQIGPPNYRSFRMSDLYTLPETEPGVASTSTARARRGI
jgi:arylsulfate sulfotransferase